MHMGFSLITNVPKPSNFTLFRFFNSFPNKLTKVLITISILFFSIFFSKAFHVSSISSDFTIKYHLVFYSPLKATYLQWQIIIGRIIIICHCRNANQCISESFFNISKFFRKFTSINHNITIRIFR